jgi:hypothetical protein
MVGGPFLRLDPREPRQRHLRSPPGRHEQERRRLGVHRAAPLDAQRDGEAPLAVAQLADLDGPSASTTASTSLGGTP